MSRMLKVRYRNGTEFLEHYQSSFLYGGLFYPTREAIPLGEAVVMEVRFPELEDRVLLRGFVAWRRQGRYRIGQRAGVGVEFLAAERHKRDFLLAVARGEMERSVSPRRHRRLPIDLRVDWRVKEDRDRHSATLDDIGPGGAFLRTRQFQPAGTPVVIEVVPPGAAAPLLIEGRVAWARQSPGEEGLGVEFRCRDTGGLRRLKELVRRLEQTEPPPPA
jgi:Tfp pilus assembly protein PilZ